jgi:hypothetical protein
MKKSVALIAGLMAASISVPALAATSVTFFGGTDTPVGGVFEDFEGYTAGSPGASIGVNAFVYDGSVGGASARPAYGSTGNFGTVLTGGSYTVNFGPTDTFSFVLGSLDTYNTLTLIYEGGATQAYVGGQIINDLTFPSGDQISGETNGVVTYVTDGPLLIGATFESSQNSFEFDNLATAVPEPATWAMMLGGFGVVGAAARRRQRTAIAYA